jgi:hypothetical protein
MSFVEPADLHADELARIAKIGLIIQLYNIRSRGIRGELDEDFEFANFIDGLDNILTMDVATIFADLDFNRKSSLHTNLRLRPMDVVYINSIWTHIKSEFRILVCTDDKKYKDIRDRVKKE